MRPYLCEIGPTLSPKYSSLSQKRGSSSEGVNKLFTPGQDQIPTRVCGAGGVSYTNICTM